MEISEIAKRWGAKIPVLEGSQHLIFKAVQSAIDEATTEEKNLLISHIEQYKRIQGKKLSPSADQSWKDYQDGYVQALDAIREYIANRPDERNTDEDK